jgi:N-acyl-D-aspartate/D-glutamate deacylase
MRAAGGWRGVTLDNAPEGFDTSLQGLSIGEIGERLDRDPTGAALDLIARGFEVNDWPTMIVHAMREDDVERFLRRPWSSVCSDSDGIAGRGHKHPRFYGTFPRVLGHYRRDRGLFGLEEAVRKLSYLGARRLGLRDRGLVQERLFADLAVFDPDLVGERGTYADPHHFPDGILHVLVNGQVVIDSARHTGALPGRGLRR